MACRLHVGAGGWVQVRFMAIHGSVQCLNKSDKAQDLPPKQRRHRTHVVPSQVPTRPTPCRQPSIALLHVELGKTTTLPGLLHITAVAERVL